MKGLRRDDPRNFRIEIIEGKIKYITQAMEFRRAMPEEKQKLPGSSEKKKPY